MKPVEIEQAKKWEKYVSDYYFSMRFGNCSRGGLDYEDELKKGSAHFDQLIPIYVKGPIVDYDTGERSGDHIEYVSLREAIRLKSQSYKRRADSSDTSEGDFASCAIAIFLMVLLIILIGAAL